MLSKEYTIWHLTPDGWIEGTYKQDFVGVTQKPIPKNRVLSCKYQETIPTIASPNLTKGTVQIWTNGNEKIISMLEKKFPFPNKL